MIIYQPFHRTLYYLADLNAQCIGCFFHLRPEMPCDGTDKMNRSTGIFVQHHISFEEIGEAGKQQRMNLRSLPVCG